MTESSRNAKRATIGRHRHGRWPWIGGCLLLASAGWAGAAAQPERAPRPPSAVAIDIAFVTEHSPMVSEEIDGRVVGAATRVIEEMAQRAGLRGSHQVLPWARAYLMAQTLPNTCVYSTVRTPEREPLFRWVGPFMQNRWYFYARSDFKGTLANLHDAKPYRIGSVLQDARTQLLEANGFPHVELVGEDRVNRNKLLAGRIDLWVTSPYRVAEGNKFVGNVKPVLLLREFDLYLACGHKTTPAITERLSAALEAMRRDGSLKRLTEHAVPRP